MLKIEKSILNYTVTDNLTPPVIPNLRLDRDGTRADRRILTAGETNGDGESTTTSPTPLRSDWWHKRASTLTGPSTTADMTARPCYAGDTSAVVIKQRTQEASGAHPECVGTKDRVGGATARGFDDQREHGGAKRRRRWCTGDYSGQNEQPTMD